MSGYQSRLPTMLLLIQEATNEARRAFNNDPLLQGLFHARGTIEERTYEAALWAVHFTGPFPDEDRMDGTAASADARDILILSTVKQYQSPLDSTSEYSAPSSVSMAVSEIEMDPPSSAHQFTWPWEYRDAPRDNTADSSSAIDQDSDIEETGSALEQELLDIRSIVELTAISEQEDHGPYTERVLRGPLPWMMPVDHDANRDVPNLLTIATDRSENRMRSLREFLQQESWEDEQYGGRGLGWRQENERHFREGFREEARWLFECLVERDNRIVDDSRREASWAIQLHGNNHYARRGSTMGTQLRDPEPLFLNDEEISLLRDIESEKRSNQLKLTEIARQDAPRFVQLLERYEAPWLAGILRLHEPTPEEIENIQRQASWTSHGIPRSDVIPDMDENILDRSSKLRGWKYVQPWSDIIPGLHTPGPDPEPLGTPERPDFHYLNFNWGTPVPEASRHEDEDANNVPFGWPPTVLSDDDADDAAPSQPWPPFTYIFPPQDDAPTDPNSADSGYKDV